MDTDSTFLVPGTFLCLTLFLSFTQVDSYFTHVNLNSPRTLFTLLSLHLTGYKFPQICSAVWSSVHEMYIGYLDWIFHRTKEPLSTSYPPCYPPLKMSYFQVITTWVATNAWSPFTLIRWCVGDYQSVGSSAPVVSRWLWPGKKNIFRGG